MTYTQAATELNQGAEFGKIARKFDPAARPQSPVIYTRNGGTKKERGLHWVARRIVRAAEEAGFDAPALYPTSWCARWPRTVGSYEAEADLHAGFWAAVAFLASASK